MRQAHKKACVTCGSEIPYEKRVNNYCSRSCAAVFNNKTKVLSRNKPPRLCFSCGIHLTKRSQVRFCSQTCAMIKKKNSRSELISNWLSGRLSGTTPSGFLIRTIRFYLREFHKNRCQLCGWMKKNPTTGICPVEIDHIDGDHLNNNFQNLRLLCPNCHSLTPTFRALNKGNGRPNRKGGRGAGSRIRTERPRVQNECFTK